MQIIPTPGGIHQPVYIYRRLINAQEFIDWAKQHFGKVLVPADLHVTCAYSKTPVEWADMNADYDGVRIDGGLRTVEPLGAAGTVVLKFTSSYLQERWQSFKDAGASWDYESYQPHVTITYQDGAVLSQIPAYTGPLLFGPEILEPLNTENEMIERKEMHQELVIKLANAEDEQRIVFAEVYAPNRPDSYGDFMNEEHIRKAAYAFMKAQRLDQIDVMHNNQATDGVAVVESFIARADDPIFIPGSWVVGVHVPDDLTWDKIKRGELNGFSLEAVVMTEKMDMHLEVPPIISGQTDNFGDHQHQFHVAFGEDGKFLGGITNSVNGHQHVIKAGTITEPADNHHHRFSAVDSLMVAHR